MNVLIIAEFKLFIHDTGIIACVPATGLRVGPDSGPRPEDIDPFGLDEWSIASASQPAAAAISKNSGPNFGPRPGHWPQPGECPLARFDFGQPEEDWCKMFQFAIVHDHRQCKRKASHKCFLCGNRHHGAFKCEETPALKEKSFVVRRFRAENFKEISKHFQM